MLECADQVKDRTPCGLVDALEISSNMLKAYTPTVLLANSERGIPAVTKEDRFFLEERLMILTSLYRLMETGEAALREPLDHHRAKLSLLSLTVALVGLARRNQHAMIT